MLTFPLIQYLAFKIAHFHLLVSELRIFDLWYWILSCVLSVDLHLCLYMAMYMSLYALHMLTFVYLNKARPQGMGEDLVHLYKLRMTFHQAKHIMVEIKAYMVAKIHTVNNQTEEVFCFCLSSSLIVSENEMTIIPGNPSTKACVISVIYTAHNLPPNTLMFSFHMSSCHLYKRKGCT